MEKQLIESLSALKETIKENNVMLKGIAKKLDRTEYVHIPKAAKLLGVSEETLRHWCEQGDVPCTLTDGSTLKKKHWLVDINGAREAINGRDIKKLRRSH